jgi:predicted aldo/keto reductase-like oxidoreductase
MEDADKILAPGGAAEFFMKLKKEGKARYLGFSAHHAGAALKLMDALPLDSVLFPVNFAAWDKGGFGPQILAKAKEKGMARLALKAMALGQWPKDLPRNQRKYPKCWYEPIETREAARLALRFTLGQEITAAIPPGDERLFDLALDLAASPLPRLNAAELSELRALTAKAEPIFRA